MTHNIIKTENYLLVVGDSDAKIIAHLPLNNSPVLEGVPLLPPLEDDVKYDFAEMFYGILKATYPDFDEWVEAKEYNKAKEKYKYTEDDYSKIKSILDDIQEDLADYQNEIGIGTMDDNQWQQLFIDRVISSITSYEDLSLQQPKMPVGFECEWTTKQMPEFHQDEPKTKTNPQGQAVLVGKYIY